MKWMNVVCKLYFNKAALKKNEKVRVPDMVELPAGRRGVEVGW